MKIDEISALNYGKLSMKLNLKSVRFRKLGFKGLYSTLSFGYAKAYRPINSHDEFMVSLKLQFYFEQILVIVVSIKY